MSCEQYAREKIDRLLSEAGWLVQNVKATNILAGREVAVREFPLKTGHVFADYLLYSEDTPAGRWRAYAYDELINRDKASLDSFWLKDESLEDSDNLPAPGSIAAEIVEDLQAALEQFREIADDLGVASVG